jgi:hypothetical protein
MFLFLIGDSSSQPTLLGLWYLWRVLLLFTSALRKKLTLLESFLRCDLIFLFSSYKDMIIMNTILNTYNIWTGCCLIYIRNLFKLLRIFSIIKLKAKAKHKGSVQ